jgi:hypothetical protein
VTITAPVEVDEATVESVAINAPEVNLALPIVIPEPVETDAALDAVLRVVPKRYLVAVEASVTI